jgi:hypothetical protein
MDQTHLLPNERLAIDGGEPVRKAPMPARLGFGEGEVKMIQEVIAFYRAKNADPGYQDHFEKLYTDAFARMMGGERQRGPGFADYRSGLTQRDHPQRADSPSRRQPQGQLQCRAG